MSVLKVIDYLTNPAPLRRKARPVREEEIYTDPFCAFARDLVDTMRAHQGMGLAATQVDTHAPDGQVWNAFALVDGNARGGVRVVLNAEIRLSTDLAWDTDGCLSFRSVPWRFRYPNNVEVLAVDDDWKPLDLRADGREARCLVHEIEHLKGRLMIDQLGPGEKAKFLTRVGKVRRAA